MLEIQPKGELIFEGQQIELAPQQLSKFLLANLSELVSIDGDVSIGDLMHVLYPIKDFISDYTCEDFGVVQAIFMGVTLDHQKPSSTVFARREMIKSIDNELLISFFAEFKLEESKESQNYLRDVFLKIDNEISLKNFEGEVLDKMYKDFTLLDLITFLFDELHSAVTDSPSIDSSFSSPSSK